MSYDLLIKNGTIVDGTGKQRFKGNVAISGGRIAAVGDVDGEAARVIDAGGQIVAPGFIDCHTHYDAQMFWDSTIDPATWHGITTMVLGNCGFTLAPVRPDDKDYALGLFSATEEVPLDVLEENLPLEWETFPEYMNRIEQVPCGVNFLAQFGHAAVRRYVMGEDSLKREATEEEIAEMVRLAEEAMDAGAWGVTTSFSPHHIDGSGGHVPSYFANYEETEALAKAVGRSGKRSFALNPKSKREGISDEDKTMMTNLAKASGVTISWNDFGAGAPNWLQTIEYMEEEIRQGRDVRVVARCQPAESRFTAGQISPLYSGDADWREFCGLSREAQLAAIATPEWRERLGQYWRKVPYVINIIVEKVSTPELKPLLGKYLTDIAAERGVDPIELMFDIAQQDGMGTIFLLRGRPKTDESDFERILKSPSTLIGVSDGGAHLQTFAGADFPTYFLKHWVREKSTFTLEEGVAALTSEVADFMGIKDRGVLEPGKAADVVIFDADTVQPELLETLQFPGGKAIRLAKRARAVPYVIVNGTPIIAEGERTGATPGHLLRA
ncbi:N-acyl-D-aspartate/D-glutamate deacylase [Novosphingobium sp. CF614]|uniref:N-acyl-D-amino-acid deacylase family protein n=1 Tax=Novosphingobium sp. CF614 TaxID=1884364 RepID=UPI0008E6AAD3|nr:amidohydrolase family protein [Novosphingobium sp. CF614]SFF90080.1 N-acyl-D-aspartate/D-glutamate deacylase [Novosphingobium sp. CF614]